MSSHSEAILLSLIDDLKQIQTRLADLSNSIGAVLEENLAEQEAVQSNVESAIEYVGAAVFDLQANVDSIEDEEESE